MKIIFSTLVRMQHNMQHLTIVTRVRQYEINHNLELSLVCFFLVLETCEIGKADSTKETEILMDVRGRF